MFQKQRKKIHKGHKSLFSTGATMLSSQLLICVVLLSSCGAFSSGNVLDGMFLQFAFYRICLAGKVITFWPLSIITIQQAFFFPRSLNWHHLLNLTAIKTYIYSTSRASQFFSLNAPIPWSNDWAEPRGGCTPLFKDNYFVTWKRA